jgi:hypothetical protein
MMSGPVLRRRAFLAALLAGGFGPARAEARRFRIAFANLDETPGVTLEGLGFTGSDVRRSFELAARTLPVDMLYFDNAGDPARAVANAEAAIAAKVDLLIEYNTDAEANAEIARRLAAAAIPALALVDPLPGAPLYGPDNRAAGRIAGHALGDFAVETWPDEQVFGVLIGDLADPGPAVSDRVQGITEGVHASLPAPAYFSAHIFAPLGMTDTGFVPSADQASRLVRVHRRGPDGGLEPMTMEISHREFFSGGVPSHHLFEQHRDRLRIDRGKWLVEQNDRGILQYETCEQCAASPR